MINLIYLYSYFQFVKNMEKQCKTIRTIKVSMVIIGKWRYSTYEWF